MAEISKITLPSGTTYDLRDDAARQAISAGFSLLVVETLPTASADTLGSIYLVSHNHGAGDTYDEFVTVKGGTASAPTYTWEKIGNTDVDLSGYSKTGHTHSVTTNVTVGDHTGLVTGGTVESSFNGTKADLTVKGTPTGSVTVTETSTGKNYTPKGSISGTAWTGSDTSFTGSYTPAGSISTPNITVATKNTSGSDVTVYSMSSAGSKTDGSYTASSYTPETYTVADGVLTITASNYTKEQVTLPTVTLPSRTQVNITASSSQPVFDGTQATITTSGTPKGSISAQGTFTGTDVKLAFSGNELTSAGEYTPTGNVTSTFNKTTSTITHSVTNNAVTSGENSK